MYYKKEQEFPKTSRVNTVLWKRLKFIAEAKTGIDSTGMKTDNKKI